MKTLVVDVAAEYGGAITVLNQFIDEYKNDYSNRYVFVLSTPKYKDTENIKFINLEWVKKSPLHRLWFDNIYIKKLIRAEKPDIILSLQNKAVSSLRVPQEVYFHNVLFLSEKKYSLRESKSLWVYQNIISRFVRSSLKKASKIYVQADWIKKKLSECWSVMPEIIEVKHPKIDLIPSVAKNLTLEKSGRPVLFYPTNSCIYKNYELLIKACIKIWDSSDTDFELVLTLQNEDLSDCCKELIADKNYPISFVGRLQKDEMDKMYQRSTLVFPSYLETIGLPLLEAKAYGADIIASDCEYAHEALDGYENATYFNPFDVDSIERSIRRFLSR